MASSKTYDKLKYMGVFGVAFVGIVSLLNACEYIAEKKASRTETEDRLQTPALLQSNAEKDFTAQGFTDLHYNSHKRKTPYYSEMDYSVKKNGVTYLANIWCDSQRCSALTLQPVRSEPAEKKAADLWKQNGYEVVSYSRIYLNDENSALEAVVSKDGRQYTGRTECEGTKCRVMSMSVMP